MTARSEKDLDSMMLNIPMLDYIDLMTELTNKPGSMHGLIGHPIRTILGVHLNPSILHKKLELVKRDIQI